MNQHCRDCGTQVVEYIESASGTVVAWWCGKCKKKRVEVDIVPSVFQTDPVGHPGINCACKECEEAKRRFRYKRRKMQAEDREREKLLGNVRAQRDNDFLQRECGIAPVVFDEKGYIVPWKGLLCDSQVH